MDLRRSVVRLGLFAALVAAQVTSANAAAPNVWVRADGSDAACNGAFNASAASAPNCSVATLQAAVNVADEGGTVYVGPGTYHGNVQIAKRVSLRGPNYLLDPTMDIRVDEAVIHAASFQVGARGVEIVGFMLDGRQAGNAKAAGLNHVINGEANELRFENNIVSNYSRGFSANLTGASVLFHNRFHATPEVAFAKGVVAERNMYDWKNARHSTSASTGSRRRPVQPGPGTVLWAMGAPRYVANGGSDTTDCSNSGTPCETINYAISQADPTDVITLAPGTYAEDVTIDKALTLMGPNAGINPNTGVRGAEAVIVPATNNFNSGHIIRVEADNVHIDGVVVDGDNPDLVGGVVHNGVDINAAYGIRNPHGAVTILVDNNIVRNLNLTGISFNMVDVGTSSSGNIIQNNKVDNMPGVVPNGRAISILNDFYANITGNVTTRTFIGIQTNNFTLSGAAVLIDNNDVQAARVGIFHNIHSGSAPSFTSSNNDITTDFTGSGAGTNMIGMWLNQISGSATVSAVNNDITEPFVGYQTFAVSSPFVSITGGTVTDASYGIRMLNIEPSFLNAPGSSNLTVTNVTITGSTIAGVYIRDDASNPNVGTMTLVMTGSSMINGPTSNGMLVDGVDVVVNSTNNTYSGNANGIVANGGALTLVSNNIINNTGTGVLFSGVATAPSLHHNRFHNNGGDGIVNTTGNQIVAENNWWGCNGGPNGGPCDGISGGGSVDAQPRLVLTITATPNTLQVGETSTVVASLRLNNQGTDTSGDGFVPDGIPVSFTSTLGTMSPTSATTVQGLATSTFTATTVGLGSASATVDNQTVTAPITITCATLPAVVVTTPRSVAIGSTGNVASVVAIPGATYVWSATGVVITGGQGTNAITFTAGSPGTKYTVSVDITEGSGCVRATSSRRGMTDFVDVPPSHIFHSFVVTLFLNDVTAGCGVGIYCPDNAVLREQMAVFLLVSKYGSTYQPPVPGATVFADVDDNSPFRRWIEDLYARGITSGCATSPLRYCPTNPVTREQMAVFLLVTEFGTSYTPPTPGAQIFADVNNASPFRPWIEDLYARNITGGCAVSPLRYCPTNPNTRGQMAVFLSVTFNLPLQP